MCCAEFFLVWDPLIHFCIYTISMMSNLSSVLFAGDTTVFVEVKNLDHLLDVTPAELCKSVKGMAIKKLSLDVKKTKLCDF